MYVCVYVYIYVSNIVKFCFQISVKALKVCKLAIQNFMPPNLVLLVEGDSHMNEIGPTLFKRLHDVNWEVRDSVLEVLNTIAAISEDSMYTYE